MDEWDKIPISRLSQGGYCLRRAALLSNEQLWQENADTAKGRAEHERVHTARTERRGDQVKLYEYRVFSERLGIQGRCDCVEAAAHPNGCRIPEVEFPVCLYPVEYKHGTVRDEWEYELQLCAQAMCLEEMFQTEIPEGALFYITSHRRLTVALTPELRAGVEEMVRKLDSLRKNYILPAAQYGPKCRSCSLHDLCMPRTATSAKGYCAALEREAKEVEPL